MASTPLSIATLALLSPNTMLPSAGVHSLTALPQAHDAQVRQRLRQWNYVRLDNNPPKMIIFSNKNPSSLFFTLQTTPP